MAVNGALAHPGKSNLEPPHIKRDHELLKQFGCLVNKGIKYFEEEVLYAAESFGDPPPDFGPNPFGSHGWTMSEGQDELPEIWDEVFADIRHAHQTQMNTNYSNSGRIRDSRTLGIKTICPRWHVRHRGIPEPQLEQHIPRLHTVADVVWETWKTTTRDPAKLRFYSVNGIINNVATPLMDYLFRRDGTPLDIGWEDRLSFGLDSDEGKALFGMPTVVAMAWLLTPRYGVRGDGIRGLVFFGVVGRGVWFRS
ncbi:MAG: hypothetical protein Q9209_001754 [Squamulea sp. 1 TL-2023]